MITSIIVLSLIGFAISLYAYLLEQKVRADSSYKALCDLSDTFSCTKPILSEYGELIGFSNSLVGMAFYLLMAALAFFDRTNLIFYFSGASLLASAFLAYILYFKIKSVCLICSSMYIINILIFIILYLNR